MGNRVLVTGSDGLVGSRFVELTSYRKLLLLPSETELDITRSSDIKNILDNHEISIIVHFAAYTNVGEAENQRGNKNDSCWQVNVEGTRNLVKAIKPYKNKIHLVHISTDMVFTGSESDPGPYMEIHKPEINPDKVTWYGFTKAEAERVAMKELENYATIVRIIYPVRAHYSGKLDYLRNPLNLFDEKKLYPLFIDQKVSITFIDELVKVIDKIIDNSIKGVFHVASNDTGTPYDIISYLLEKARGNKISLEKANVNTFLKDNNLSPIRYPKFGGLDSEETQKVLGMNFRNWREIVDELVLQNISAD